MVLRVIVEGPDGAGKTTLIRKLTEATGLGVMPRAADSIKGPMLLGDYIVKDALAHSGQDGIYDRHPLISEMVYGPTLRGRMKFWEDRPWDPTWLEAMLKLFYDSQPYIIYCLPPWEEVLRNVDQGEHLEGVLHRIHILYELYWVMYTRDIVAHPNIFRWDYTTPDNFNFLVDRIRERITNHDG